MFLGTDVVCRSPQMGFRLRIKYRKTHVSDRVSQAFCRVTSKLGIDICVTSKPAFAKGDHDIKSQMNTTSRYFTPVSSANPWIFLPPQAAAS